MMRFCAFGVFLLFFVHSPVSAGFYPNSSAIPPELRHNATENVWNSFLNFTGHAGMKVNGLYKIKQYFQHFGYIPETLPGNFTDDFDDILKNAVKMYQSNFGLNVTGEILTSTALDLHHRPLNSETLAILVMLHVESTALDRF